MKRITLREGEISAITPDLLMPNVWFSRIAGDRWLQVGDQRLQVPLRVGVYSHQARVVRFVYPGVYKIYGKAVVNGPGVLPALKEFIDSILAQDELYEHWISVGMLHRVAHEGEPHFLRIEPKRVGAYTGIYENPRGPIHYPCPGEGHSHNAMEQSRRLAIAYRQDILNTRWTRSPDIAVAAINPPYSRVLTKNKESERFIRSQRQPSGCGFPSLDDLL